MKPKEIKKLTAFFFEIGNLRKVIRAHQQTLLSFDLSDTIASHSFRVVFIGYFLAKEIGADVDRVVKMCLLHDLEETRSSDHNWVHKRYVKVFEDEIRRDQLKDLPNSEELIKLSKEYEAKDWLKGIHTVNQQEKMMSTKLAREVAIEAKKQAPSFWWENLWTAKRR